MSDLGGERFALTAVPPVRALATAAVAAIIGVALMLGSRVLGLGQVVLIMGVVALVVAVLVAGAAVVLVTWIGSTLVLDPDGVTVTRGRRASRMPWSKIKTVSLAGPRLTFVNKEPDGTDVSVLNPRGTSDPTFQALVAAIRGRLDADRGYRTR